MSRPKEKLLLEVGRWQLCKDAHGWVVKDGNGNVCWPGSLAVALATIYENVVVDSRFAQDTQDDIKALRDAILQANKAFEDLLTPPKVAELNQILRKEQP